MIRRKPFHQLRASDVMSRELILIPDDMPLSEAARRLVREQVSGAPVVDCNGALVGVVSSSDFVRFCSKPDATSSGGCGCVYAEWQIVDIDNLPSESVARIMTTDPVTASVETPVTVLAQMMVDAHIHRIVIIDANRIPLGIVATSDILGAVARMNAAEAMN